MLIKSPDDRSKRLRLLEDLRNSDRLDESQKKWLKTEYWRLAPGIAGERDAAHYLDLSFSESKNHAVLHDLRLEADGQVAQIDHLVIDRTFSFFLLETKTYNGNLHINEHGEFMVEYANERTFGIESPLEQSRRHETVLKKVIERVGISGRIGTKPIFVHVVMIHPKGIIHRPPADRFDTSMIIKADQFATWHSKHVDKLPVADTLVGMMNMRGRGTVKEWGEKLKAEHRASNPLDLPEFMRPKPAPTPIAEKAVAMPATPTIAADTLAAPPQPTCVTCGKDLSEKVIKFCTDNAARFGGRLYCFSHQPRPKQTKQIDPP